MKILLISVNQWKQRNENNQAKSMREINEMKSEK